jgi:hypothetical protein
VDFPLPFWEGPDVKSTLLGVVLVLALGAAPAAADETVLPPTAFDVDGGSVTTPALEAGAQYRLESGGTFQDVGPNVAFDHDAAYCYGDDNPSPICEGDPSLSNTGLWAGYSGSDAAPFYRLEGAAPAYTDTHRYVTRFTASQNAPLRLLANTPEVGHEYPGQLGVALYKVSGASCAGSLRACTSPFAEEPTPGQRIVYPRPAANATDTALGPSINRKVKSASIDVDTYSLDIFAIVPDDAALENADVICGTFYLGAHWRELLTVSAPPRKFTTCAAAVGAVLQRCQELKQQRGGPGLCGGDTRRTAHIASGACGTKAIRWQGGPKSKLKLRCKPIGPGVRVYVKPRKKHARLRKVLGAHPRLVLGSSYAETSQTEIGVTWRLRR